MSCQTRNKSNAMNTPILKRFAIALGAFLFAIALLAVSCKKSGADAKPADVDYYTCTMHPSVRSQDPKAKCPICSMNLVPVMKKGAAMHDHAGHGGAMPGMPMESGTNVTNTPAEFTVPIQRQQQIGVTYGGIQKNPFILTIRAVGTVAYDKQ